MPRRSATDSRGLGAATAADVFEPANTRPATAARIGFVYPCARWLWAQAGDGVGPARSVQGVRCVGFLYTCSKKAVPGTEDEM